ncbi:MAG TPA: beta-ketoacyl synthase N-terminal-like domain-containing protein, partial [Acetobacteraceae bacterium]|nr:beta-ketoacyl synthase N-terminal-like domain-containing protein [Acetobacteraceae bacterium]
MGADLDKSGRPVVVVTGIGALTSLGEGIEENWTRLTQGRSGIRRITRFPLEGLRTTIAGAVDFIPADSSVALAEAMARRAAEEAIAGAGIGAKGDFPGPLFLALAPVEIEWLQRRALAEAAGGGTGYAALLRAADTGAFTPWHPRFLFGSVAEALAEVFGTKGSPIATSTACASGATAIQLGVEAIRRGESDAALCVGTDASVNQETLIRFSLLSALS